MLDVDWMRAGPKIECGGGLETVNRRLSVAELQRTAHKMQREARQHVVQNEFNRRRVRKETRLAGTRATSKPAALPSTTNRLVVRPELLWISSHVFVSESVQASCME